MADSPTIEYILRSSACVCKGTPMVCARCAAVHEIREQQEEIEEMREALHHMEGNELFRNWSATRDVNKRITDICRESDPEGLKHFGTVDFVRVTLVSLRDTRKNVQDVTQHLEKIRELQKGEEATRKVLGLIFATAVGALADAAIVRAETMITPAYVLAVVMQLAAEHEALRTAQGGSG